MKRILVGVVALALITVACADSPDDPVGSDGRPQPTTGLPTTGPIEVPADASPFFVDSTDILLMESFPVQVALRVNGNLPSPCHQPVWEVEDDGEAIHVTLATVADNDRACTQVLVPTELSIPLGSFESGARTVILNGEEVGDFEI
jgi:hypothetical protein